MMRAGAGLPSKLGASGSAPSPRNPIMADGTEDRGSANGDGKILVVDDEDLVRMVVARMLERQGFAVLTAAGGAEAVELLLQHHGEIACVLLDLKMPRMDGEQTLSAIREIDGEVPVILSSAYCEPESTRRFGQSFTGFIRKPYQPASLQEKLREVLGSRA